jgi:trehalose/maltose hydrolase-like predicted phosphorylase
MLNTTMKMPHYAFDEWRIIERKFEITNNYQNETIFALGNGYLGMRGTFEESYQGPDWPGLEGTYINGFYESEKINYPEIAYGYPEKSQTMLNVTNCKIIKLIVDDEEFNMMAGGTTDYHRELSFKEGLLRRSLIWSSPRGKKVKIDICRLISFVHQHWAVIRYEVTPLNFSGKIKLITALDGNVSNLTSEKDPRVGSGLQGRVLMVEQVKGEGDCGLIVQSTENSGLTLATAMLNRIETENRFAARNIAGEVSVQVEYEFTAAWNVGISLTKYIVMVTSKHDNADEIVARAEKEILQAEKMGFDGIKTSQMAFLADFWSRSDIEIKGAPAIQQGIRFNIFHLLQAVGRDGQTNIAAKGLTGEGYEGHYFWDTETYILPFFLYNNPGISRKLLEFRYNTLSHARERARQMSHQKGALFPWRTINGDECSTYFPGGTAQYHINADIALAVKRYMEATADWDFLINYGAEIIFETARVWADLGAFNPEKGNQFCINGVTGPDEYTAIVNNNCYTNLMARENFNYACQVAEWMKTNAPPQYEKLTGELGLARQELEFWKNAAEHMYIPYNPEKRIHLQDDDFLNRAPWDFENTPADKYPLLMHYHPLVIYRHQVCKQADLVLALFLLGWQFSKEQKQRDFDFYEKVTTHDSSLSICIFSIIASEIGYNEKAYQYFLDTVRTDLDDIHGNTRDGIHAANMAGAWMCLVNGFAGMRVYDGVLSFNPVLPDHWQEYSFRITLRNKVVKVTIKKSGIVFELLKGDQLALSCRGKQITLDSDLPAGRCHILYLKTSVMAASEHKPQKNRKHRNFYTK